VATVSAAELDSSASPAGTSGADGAAETTDTEAAGTSSAPLRAGAFGIRGVPTARPEGAGDPSLLATKILGLAPGGLALRSGLQVGDVVTSFKGRPVGPEALLRDYVSRTPRGGSFTLGVVRNGVALEIPVTVDVQLTQPRAPSASAAARPAGRPGRSSHDPAPASAADQPPTTLTTWAPWKTGLTAMFVPTSVQRLLGVQVVSGGRGLLAVTDIDTLFFDVVIGWAFFTTMFRRASYRSATFVLVLALTIAIALPMMYTVTNFGTLFRLRGMILFTAALLPLAALSRRERLRAAVEREGVIAA
jgi:hypothetical protein